MDAERMSQCTCADGGAGPIMNNENQPQEPVSPNSQQAVPATGDGQTPDPASGESPGTPGTPGTPGASGTPGSMSEEAIRQASSEVEQMNDAINNVAAPVPLDDFENATDQPDAAGIGMLGDVDLDVRIELGRTRMLVEDVLKLNPESVVELDKAAGDPVDIYVNGRHVARGEVLVLNENFCVRVSEIIGKVPTPSETN